MCIQLTMTYTCGHEKSFEHTCSPSMSSRLSAYIPSFIYHLLGEESDDSTCRMRSIGSMKASWPCKTCEASGLKEMCEGCLDDCGVSRENQEGSTLILEHDGGEREVKCIKVGEGTGCHRCYDGRKLQFEGSFHFE